MSVETSLDPVAEARELWRCFGRKAAIRDVDVRIAAGGVTVLLGANGAGKSTFLRLLLGIVRPTYGRVRVLGVDPKQEGDHLRRRVGFVPDHPDAYGWMTPREWFRFLAPHYPTWDDGLARSLADELGVPMTTRFRALSRGEAAKAMLVSAVAFRPELLVLDEPFGRLDPIARVDVLRAIIGQVREEGRTTLLSTHDLDVAARVADRVLVMQDGRIARQTTPDELVAETTDDSLPARMLHVLVEAHEPAEDRIRCS